MRREEDFFKKVEQVAEKDGRYRREAYFFLYSALEYTVERLGKKQKIGKQRHVTGQELLKGISEYGIKQYGPMTQSVFEYWGITSTRDFGEIVFALVNAGLMNRTDEDSLEDFEDVYNFDEEFDWRNRKKDHGSLL